MTFRPISAIDRDIHAVQDEISQIEQQLERDEAQRALAAQEILTSFRSLPPQLQNLRHASPEECQQTLQGYTTEQLQQFQSVAAENQNRIQQCDFQLRLIQENIEREEALHANLHRLQEERADTRMYQAKKVCLHVAFALILILAIGLVIGGALGLYQMGSLSYAGSHACLWIGSSLALLALISKGYCLIRG